MGAVTLAVLFLIFLLLAPPFVIIVETSEDGFRLVCQKGCTSSVFRSTGEQIPSGEWCPVPEYASDSWENIHSKRY